MQSAIILTCQMVQPQADRQWYPAKGSEYCNLIYLCPSPLTLAGRISNWMDLERVTQIIHLDAMPHKSNIFSRIVQIIFHQFLNSSSCYAMRQPLMQERFMSAQESVGPVKPRNIFVMTVQPLIKQLRTILQRFVADAKPYATKIYFVHRTGTVPWCSTDTHVQLNPR